MFLRPLRFFILFTVAVLNTYKYKLQVICFMLIMISEYIIIADDPFANGTNNQHRCSQKSLQENGPTSCDIAFCGTRDSVCCIAKHKPYRTKAAHYSCP